MQPTKLIDGNVKPIAKRNRFLRLLDRCFPYESMSGNGRCPVYLERWTLFNRWNHGVYLHRFLGDDWAIDPHDHPRRFISIRLGGWYWEDVFPGVRKDCPDCHGYGKVAVTRFAGTESYYFETVPCPCSRREPTTIRHRAPWIRTFPADHLHRIRAKEHGNCWTLVIVLPKTRPWGFVRDGVWMPVKEYVFGGKARPSC